MSWKQARPWRFCEAMKMHYEIVAEGAGAVLEVLAGAGQQVAADDVLVEIEVSEPD